MPQGQEVPLCTFVPLYLCTIALHQSITNHLYVNTLDAFTFTGYTYTHWYYTNPSLKSHFIFKNFLLICSFVLCISPSVTHFVDSHLHQVELSWALLFTFFNLAYAESFQLDYLFLVIFYICLLYVSSLWWLHLVLYSLELPLHLLVLFYVARKLYIALNCSVWLHI